MTEENQQITEMQKRRRRRRRCLIISVGPLIIFILLIVFLILAFTLFRAKHPTTHLISVELAGVAPGLSFPPTMTNFQLNVTLILQVKVKNPNYAGFRHATGKGYLLYRDNQVGDADILPGMIQARKSSTLACRLTLQVAQVVSDAGELISDVMDDGEFTVESRAVIPGRVSFLGFIKKHAVAKSECSYTIAVPEFKIKDHSCKTKTKL